MALLNCPDCGKEVSDQAGFCPGCGHPIKAVVIEQTSKKLKRIQLISIIMIVVGIFFMISGATSSESGVVIFSILLTIAGFVGYFTARFKIWWHHK